MLHPAHELRRLQGRARKRFGQHFLASEGVIRRIIALSGVGPGSRVLEIGPGLGALTGALVDAGAEVVAVELDRDMAEYQRERFGDAVRVIETDAAKVEDWGELLGGGGGWSCVANLPYNVGTTITTNLLRRPDVFDQLVLMLQREVADRMVAPAGSRQRGSLSVFVEARADAALRIKVPPGAFHPPPKVHSGVIRLGLRAPDCLAGVDLDGLERVCLAGFKSPRKTVRNTLTAAFGRDLAGAALVTAGVAPSARPAVLTLEEWARLSVALVPG